MQEVFATGNFFTTLLALGAIAMTIAIGIYIYAAIA